MYAGSDTNHGPRLVLGFHPVNVGIVVGWAVEVALYEVIAAEQEYRLVQSFTNQVRNFDPPGIAFRNNEFQYTLSDFLIFIQVSLLLKADQFYSICLSASHDKRL